MRVRDGRRICDVKVKKPTVLTGQKNGDNWLWPYSVQDGAIVEVQEVTSTVYDWIIESSQTGLLDEWCTRVFTKFDDDELEEDVLYKVEASSSFSCPVGSTVKTALIGRGRYFWIIPEHEDRYKQRKSPTSEWLYVHALSVAADIVPEVLDIKAANSCPEATNCAKCGGPLKQPWPDVKFCPVCEP